MDKVSRKFSRLWSLTAACTVFSVLVMLGVSFFYNIQVTAPFLDGALVTTIRKSGVVVDHIKEGREKHAQEGSSYTDLMIVFDPDKAGLEYPFLLIFQNPQALPLKEGSSTVSESGLPFFGVAVQQVMRANGLETIRRQYTFPLPLVIAILVVMGYVGNKFLRKLENRRSGLCVHCEYPLRLGICTECGKRA